MRLVYRLSCLGLLSLAALDAQTTQGLIAGRVLNSVTGAPVAGASVSYTSTTLAASGTLTSDTGGYYFLPLLSAGTYTIRATADSYQAQELQQLELPVAGRVQLDFALRPLSDVWESGQYRSVFLPGTKTIVTFYGPDVDPTRSGTFEAQKGQRGTLDTSQSYVIDPVEIGNLPLLGRDVFAMLVTLPTVAADSATGRGLGVSVAGQRPSSTNYLLDGVENDNYLVTGPLSPVAPEAVQEYRISTNNYSAEYGRTAGFVANAVTRAGGPEYHGILYEYFKNDDLEAADFQDNVSGMGRRFDRENQFGYQVGGPVIPRGAWRNRLFFSSALEELISHSKQDPQTFLVPTSDFLPGLGAFLSPVTKQLLTEFPPFVTNAKSEIANYTVAPPVNVDRTIALERGDYTSKSGRDHLMARLAILRTTEPDFSWTPWQQFVSPLYQRTTGIAGNWTHTWSPRITSEFKLSYTDDNLWWNRAHPEIPTLLDSLTGISLPGSPLFYEYRNHNRSPETIYSTIWTRNRHVITAGLGFLFRFNSGYLTAGRDGEYEFNGDGAFAADLPNTFGIVISRLSPTISQPNYDRDYGYTESYFFVQDSFRVTQRLTLNYGLRYERFGAPQNTGATKDALLALGNGANFNARLAGSTLTIPGSGNQQIYGADNGDFAPRFGFSWDPLGKSKTVVRGGFGIFYDRPFDNLWQNVRNNNDLLNFYTPTSNNYLQPISTVLPSYQPQVFQNNNFPDITLLDPKLKNGYTQTSFVGVQQAVGDNLTVEVNGTSALGRRLITTDVVNRQFTQTDPGPVNTYRPAPYNADVAWRSGEGKSDYYALSTLVRYRIAPFQLQASYTWSHSIDNQSDPLVGDFFDLNFSTITSVGASQPRASFTRQFNSNGDRGNSDFDQRHNLVLVGIWQSPYRRLAARGWQFSFLAAFRTGTPYSVEATNPLQPASGGVIDNQRADLVGSVAPVYSTPPAVAGGVQLINPAAFAIPAPASTGNTGRNEFRGPGLYSADVSLARSFRVPRLREGTTFTVRADAYNFLNHANLGNPDSTLGDPNFGLSTYGRQGTASGFPAVTPLNETARQIQLLVRLQF